MAKSQKSPRRNYPSNRPVKDRYRYCDIRKEIECQNFGEPPDADAWNRMVDIYEGIRGRFFPSQTPL